MANYTITAKGRKLDMAALKAAQAKNVPIKSKNVKTVKTVKTENKNIVVKTPAKLKATVPSTAPVTVSTESVDVKEVISQLIKSKKSKGE